MERPGVLAQIRCKGANRVRAGHPGQKGGAASERKGLQGVEGREMEFTYGLSQHFDVWGKGLPQKGPISPGDLCREEMEQLMKQWVLLEKPGLWSWTLLKMLLLHSSSWQLPTGMEAAADRLEGQLAAQVGFRGAATGWTSCALLCLQGGAGAGLLDAWLSFWLQS